MSVTQAMLLAAGYATRMRPLTDRIAKPMVPFLGRTMLDYALDYLESSGIKELAINIHHSMDEFKAFVSERNTSIRISLFEEKEKILGTGGGIKNMQSFVTTDTFAVVNCDFLTDIDVRKAVSFHETQKAIATMLLVPTQSEKNYATIGIDSAGKIIHFPYGSKQDRPTQTGNFSGIHIFQQSIFSQMPNADVFGINKHVYGPMLDQNLSIGGYLTEARWYDVGELDLYRKAEAELKAKPLAWMNPQLFRIPNGKN